MSVYSKSFDDLRYSLFSLKLRQKIQISRCENLADTYIPPKQMELQQICFSLIGFNMKK